MKTITKQIILGALLAWNVVGAITSIANQWDEVHIPGTFMQYEWVHSNCVYHSISAFTNVGYILTCELYRTRWEIGK